MCTSELFPNTKEGPCLFLLLLLGEMMNRTYLELVAQCDRIHCIRAIVEQNGGHECDIDGKIRTVRETKLLECYIIEFHVD